MAQRKVAAAFVEPMLLLRKEKLPEGPDWLYEVKLDGYRAIAIKTGEKVQLRSRNDNDFNHRYPGIVRALAPLPAETVLDGEVVALDEAGKPSFNKLQNFASFAAPVFYFVFDLLVLFGRDLMGEPLATRRTLLEKR
jgi:ATP-dependent DNA ligase